MTTSSAELELFFAVMGDFTERVEELLRRPQQRSILHRAAQNNNPKKIQRLLHRAAQNNNPTVIHMLLAAGARVGSRDSRGSTPLHYACWYKASPQVVKALLVAGADPSEKDVKGHTPLMDACWVGHWRVIEKLVERGASLAEVDSHGNTLLHIASKGWSDETKTLEVLLEKGAEIEAKNEWGQTALGCASLQGCAKIVDFLIKHGSCVTTGDRGGKQPIPANDGGGSTPLHYACKKAHPKVVELLVKAGADVNSRKVDRCTPLHDALVYHDDGEARARIVRFLFENGADWNTPGGPFGSTPFHWACEHGTVEIVRIFLDQDADTEVLDERGATPLCSACSADEDQLYVVQELVSRGADWSYKSPEEGTPYDCARKHDRGGIMHYLKQQYLDSITQVEGHLGLLSVLREAKYSTMEVSTRLGLVAIENFVNMLATIVSGDPDAIRKQDQDHALPLHIACRARAHFEVVKFLIAPDPVTLHISDDTGSLPIHAACAAGSSLETIQHFVAVGGVGTLRARDHECALPLHCLCKAKPSVDTVKLLLRKYPRSVLSRTLSGDLPVVLAVKHRASVDVMFELFKANPGALADM